MDLTDSVLNLANMNMFHQLKTKGKRCYKRWLIPSISEVEQVFTKVGNIVKLWVPFEIKQFQSEERLQLRMDRLVPEVIQAFKLHYVSNIRPVGIRHTNDSSNLTKNINYAMGGINLNNPAAIDLLTESLMFAGMPKEKKIMVSVHNQNNCFPIMLIIGQKMHRNIEPMYYFFQEARLTIIHDWKLFKVTGKTDMSATWKIFGWGRTTKSKKDL